MPEDHAPGDPAPTDPADADLHRAWDTLRRGDVEVVVDAGDGARLRSVRLGGHELLHTTPQRSDGGVDPLSYGSFVMAPWAGRIRDAHARFGDRSLTFTPDEDGHGLHGLVLDRPWDTVGPGIHEVHLPAADRTPATPPTSATSMALGWFEPLTIRQELQLRDDGLELRLTATPAAPTPVTLGWHPWFVRRFDDADATVSLPDGARMLAKDPAGITTDRRVPPSPGPWDDTFVDLDGPIVVAWGDRLRLEISHDGPAAVVFTGRSHAICVEPQSGPPNEVNGPAPRVVTPQQPLTMISSWRWFR